MRSEGGEERRGEETEESRAAESSTGWTLPHAKDGSFADCWYAVCECRYQSVWSPRQNIMGLRSRGERREQGKPLMVVAISMRSFTVM